MNAVVKITRDVSPNMEMMVTIEIGARSIEATVKYRVSYPSIWHRGQGLDVDVDVLSVTHQVGTDIRQVPMFPGLLDRIVAQIEADELELN